MTKRLEDSLSLFARTCVTGMVMTALFCVVFSGNVGAGICFLPDCEDRKISESGDSGAEACVSAGFESDKSRLCNEYSIIEYCPQNSAYIKCNDARWCLVNEYTITECEFPSTLFNKCPNGQEMYKGCKPNMEAICHIEDPAYVNSCRAGWTLDPDQLCSYSDEWGKCCNMCPGYEYTEDTLPEGLTAVASCNSCDGVRYIAGGLGNVCEGFWDCQDGCEIGSETCNAYNGVVKCKVCKRCEARCSNLSCPFGAMCEYENCTQRYCDPTGCAEGYTSFCEAPREMDCHELGYTVQKGACVNAMGMFGCPFNSELVKCIADDGTCCERFCEGFDYDYDGVPPGYVLGASCDCCGKKKYKIELKTCTGYVNADDCEYGIEDALDTCQEGSLTKYRRCKECPNATSNKYCPVGYVCTYDSCSKSYQITGCAVSYTEFCDVPETNCEALGYKYIGSECQDGGTIVYCPYDSSFAACIPPQKLDCCRLCTTDGYTYEVVPDGYKSVGTCQCCGVTKHKIEMNTCEGYVTAADCEYGVDTTSQMCRSGEIRAYASCISCLGKCEYSICPDGYVCTYDSCSKTYCPSGCAVGYGAFCDAPETNCEELGYYSYRQVECATKEMIRCPYDVTKVQCE